MIAIIGTLVALLLPAIQATREASRKASCKNNLRQVGVGMHNFEAAFGRLPPGYQFVAGPNGNLRGFSWCAWLLPFMELRNLHDQLDFDKPVFDNVNKAVRMQHIETLLCPTDDHGHMVLFQTGHTPNHADSDDRDVSAPHAGVAQFLMCDGSVHTVSEEIEFHVYQALGTMNAAEAIAEL